jgi:hypothetical protein
MVNDYSKPKRSILESQRPERVYVLYFDTVVQKVETYEAGQRIDLNPVGGGGTEFGYHRKHRGGLALTQSGSLRLPLWMFIFVRGCSSLDVECVGCLC